MVKKEKLLISSCFLGELVKYNGEHNLLDSKFLERLQKQYILYPFCPEVEGGLPVPRVPCEIVCATPLKVINKNGDDKTLQFLKGAKKTLELCKKENITKALLKANSPSCGSKAIYDGTFSGEKTEAKGVTAKLLFEHKIKVFDETDIKNIT